MVLVFPSFKLNIRANYFGFLKKHMHETGQEKNPKTTSIRTHDVKISPSTHNEEKVSAWGKQSAEKNSRFLYASTMN